MHKNIEQVESLVNELHTSGSGYDILRYVCLPDLLGKEANTILYVLGKNLARNLNPSTIEEVINFFNKTGWGELVQVKEKRREFIFELTGEPITKRIKADILTEYRMEAGFLAQSIEQIKSISCECIDEIKRKKNRIQFNVIYSK